MDVLIAGYRSFRAGTWRAERSRFEELSRLGQDPRALVIACSDSRTDPQMVFNAVPGELFVIRNIANLVPPYGPDDQPHGVSSAIEFAVRTLRVRAIVVMGHAMCGGMRCSTVRRLNCRISSANGCASPSPRDSAPCSYLPNSAMTFASTRRSACRLRTS